MNELSLTRGSLFGFFAGSTAAAAATYYYVLEEYRLSNEMLTEDIYVRMCI
jgi:zinc finger HIT domain-containing protein 1